MEVERLLKSLVFVIVPIVAVFIYIGISWQFFPKECPKALAGSSRSILGSLKSCMNNCWSKHDFGGDLYSDDCNVVSINTTSDLSKASIEKFLGEPAKVYFDSLQGGVDYKIKIRYNSTGKEISLILFED